MSKDKVKNSKSFEFNRKSIIILVIISLAGILTGVFVGSYFIGGYVPDYSQYSEAMLRDDVKTLSQRAEGRSPSQFKAYEIFEIAEYRMFTHGSVLVTSSGEVDTIASQTISGVKAYENGTYFKENLSKGIKNVGERTYYNEGDDLVTKYEASKISSQMVGTYKSPKNVMLNDYKNTVGVPVTSFVGYIVSSKTVLNVNDSAKKVSLENGETGYEFSLQLNAITSVLNYVKQMKDMSQLPDYPAFTDITLNVVVDEEFRFIKIETLEHYSVNYMGINAKCTGTLVEIYEYGKTNIIPETLVA